MHSNNFYGGHHGFGNMSGHRARRGDMGPIILRQLLEKPMHGYEIISNLEEKSQGMWRPSAGAVYPNLQMLEEQGLVTLKDVDGKKIYSLTDTGKEKAEKAQESFTAHWEEMPEHAKRFKELRMGFFEIKEPLFQLADNGSVEKVEAAKKILKEARDKLSSLIEKDS
jgi:DNA-binding PadR family transcriptional regulator